ncbi:MAG: tetrahydrofolate dehydrogenase/cyclohydrolase catalytic domain-containing protein [Clostridium sp.]|uniref:bifunctional 5,10-methylenetetrahydrofolate dehydrogenase/5,10-methenyltetrahydrofolate cyclohydrolase n=1 Tax=Clostridium culturomicium TaxID=1499683 RepID=UPI00058BD207|nr:tetrahydrofolate dehydrogenase/cyclohydrolase catalytic domain-containing protein [Clostridium culturomicium]MDU4892461.1 tetrahydrofolate dehydrogenase/cyclohydrolase catalytic domain-containing protein [Clostridium sp.]MDU7084472.1 tetrahydrofolate dehydrogenase/cyclohydrolase catalytic domain-containing protein [Clostridium sp.]
MAVKLSGKELALSRKISLKEAILKGTSEGKRHPALASVIVGEDGGSLSYIKGQKKVSEELGIRYDMKTFDGKISEEELINEIEELNSNEEIDGIIIQLPLPAHLNEDKILSCISADKDVDGLTDVNFGKFCKGREAFIPCTARSILKLIKSTEENLEGKRTVVLGRSNIVGKPVAMLLLGEHTTVSICHSRTENMKEICRGADILISAMGKPAYITKDFVKDGAIVIDVGTTMVEGKVRGDVDFDEVSQVAGYITPVPGGVGAMTTTMLMENTYEAWIKNVY